ncbi:MAG: trigger factor [Lachnospiraceae bacterium]|jgi:trigger factor
MSLQVEKLEKSMAKLTIEVSAEEFEKAMESAYHKNKGKMNIPGFRKGKAPRAMLEKMYGASIFYDDAANAVIPEAYEKAAEESGLEIVSRPEIDVVQIEKGKSFIFTAEVALKPEVTLGQYKGIEVPKMEVEVTEEEIAAELKKEQDNNSRMIVVDDRAVQDKDQITLDFDGYYEGEPFEGGKGEDYPLIIGSNTFIPGFEEQLIGAEIGKETEIHVTFPEDYHAKDLAGKPVVFKCTVKDIKVKELPELDDEFAQEVSEFDTLAEYKESIQKKLVDKKEAEAKGKKEDAVIKAIIEGAEMEIPEPMIQTQIGQMVSDFAQRMQQQGISLDQYMSFTGIDMNQIREQMKPQAVERIQSRLVLEKVAELEKIEVSDEKLEVEMKMLAEGYKVDLEQFKAIVGEAGKAQMKQDMAVQEAVVLVTDAAVEVEEVKEEA